MSLLAVIFMISFVFPICIVILLVIFTMRLMAYDDIQWFMFFIMMFFIICMISIMDVCNYMMSILCIAYTFYDASGIHVLYMLCDFYDNFVDTTHYMYIYVMCNIMNLHAR